MDIGYYKELLTTHTWPTLKKIIRNIEWPIIIGIWGFFTLVITVNERGYSFVFTAFITLLAIILTCLTAYNSYRHKSTTLIDKYEERFFVQMEDKRRSAAKFLLGDDVGGLGNVSLKDVLDFFESPIGQKVKSGEIDVFQTYSYFHHWIILYIQASKDFVYAYRKEEPTAWGSLNDLYKEMCRYERLELMRDTGKPCADIDLIWPEDKLKKYLREEAM